MAGSLTEYHNVHWTRTVRCSTQGCALCSTNILMRIPFYWETKQQNPL